LAPFVFVGHASVSPISMVCRSDNGFFLKLFSKVSLLVVCLYAQNPEAVGKPLARAKHRSGTDVQRFCWDVALRSSAANTQTLKRVDCGDSRQAEAGHFEPLDEDWRSSACDRSPAQSTGRTSRRYRQCSDRAFANLAQWVFAPTVSAHFARVISLNPTMLCIGLVDRSAVGGRSDGSGNASGKYTHDACRAIQPRRTEGNAMPKRFNA
jgi:hypothetical protein